MFADALGVSMLRGRAQPSRLLIAEGLTDFLTWAAHWGVDGALELAPAVLAIVSGSWTPEIAARVPGDTEVLIATDADERGDHYAAKVAELLRGRCMLRRWRPA